MKTQETHNEVEDKQPTVYAVQVKCANCGDERMYTIEKGVTKEEALEEQRCKKCDCKILVKLNKSISPYQWSKMNRDNKKAYDDKEQEIDFTELDDDVE